MICSQLFFHISSASHQDIDSCKDAALPPVIGTMPQTKTLTAEKMLLCLQLLFPILFHILAYTLNLAWDYATSAFSFSPASTADTAQDTVYTRTAAEIIAAGDQERLVELQHRLVGLVLEQAAELDLAKQVIAAHKVKAETNQDRKQESGQGRQFNVQCPMTHDISPPPAQSAQPPRRGHKSSTASRHRRKIAREHAFRHRPLVPPAQSNVPPREGPQGVPASNYWPPTVPASRCWPQTVPTISLEDGLYSSRPPSGRWCELTLSSSSLTRSSNPSTASLTRSSNPSTASLTRSSLWTSTDSY